MEKAPIIIGIGEFLWDMLPAGKKAGGAPVNFAYQAAQMGAESYAVSAIGNDVLGDELISVIDKIDVRYLIERVNYPTGTVKVKLKEGLPDYTIIENVAWDYIPLTTEIKQLAQRADAICFGTLAQRSETSRNTIQAVLSMVPPDAYRIFDINIRQHFYSKEIIEQSLQACNVFKVNNEELDLLKEMFNKQQTSDDAVCKWFVDTYKLNYVILTAGDNYSTIYTPISFSQLKTPVVDVLDTVGAGDAFTGAFIASILNGYSLTDAHQEAVNRAAYVCTKSGAWV